MSVIIRVFTAIIITFFTLWVSITTFLPTVGQIMGVGVDLGAFTSPLVPSFWSSGVWWSFSGFVLGVIGIMVIWGIATMLELLAVGRSR